MKINARKAALNLPGITGTARVGRRTGAVLPRLRPGDIAVIDHVDMDRDTASALVASGVRVVVNAGAMISGRYANLGPEVLAEADVMLVDQIGVEGLEAIRDDQEVRVHGGVVYLAHPDGQPEVLATGRELDLEVVHADMAQARSGLVVQMDNLTHSTSEFLRREQELLLNGRGLPDLETKLADRPVVVVAEAGLEDMQAIRRFVREQTPAVIAVGATADDLLGLSWAPDVVVITAGDPGSVPSLDAMRIAKDVLVLAPLGARTAEVETLKGLGIVPKRVESSATAEDIALLLADRDGAALVVAVGLHARLEDFLDRQQTGLASTFATRLKVGSRLIDAAAVRALYSARTRPSQVALVVAIGCAALAAAIATTPEGQDWAQGIVDYLQGLT